MCTISLHKNEIEKFKKFEGMEQHIDNDSHLNPAGVVENDYQLRMIPN